MERERAFNRGRLGQSPRLLSVESFANFGRELFGVERFGKEKHAGLAAIARLE